LLFLGDILAAMSPEPTAEKQLSSAEILKACIDLAGAAQARFVGRRDIEFKVTIGVWTLLAASYVFLRPESLQNSGAMVFACILAFSAYAWWILGVWKSSQRDKSARDHYLEQADMLLRNAAHAPSEYKFEGFDYSRFPRDAPAFAQIIVTLALLLGLGPRLLWPGGPPTESKLLTSSSQSASRFASAAEMVARSMDRIAQGRQADSQQNATPSRTRQLKR
jgi:hypothetical protein